MTVSGGEGDGISLAEGERDVYSHTAAEEGPGLTEKQMDLDWDT